MTKREKVPQATVRQALGAERVTPARIRPREAEVNKTKIQWTDQSVNPFRAWDEKTAVPGQTMGHHCVKVSAGCTNCYASKLQSRFRMPPYEAGKRKDIEVFFDEKVLQSVLRRRKPAKIFWCDMTDMFLDAYPDEWIDKCFAVMALTPYLTHQVLTKRPERMRSYINGARARVWTAAFNIHEWVNATPFGPEDAAVARAILAHQSVNHEEAWPLPNVWCGVSVEDQATADERITILLDTPAAVRWVSAEPLLGPVDLRGGPTWEDWLRGIGVRPRMPDGEPEQFPTESLDWVVVGGESGPGARPCNVEWIRAIVRQCKDAGVACFVKQLGARPLMGIHDIPGELYRELDANGLDSEEIHKAALEGRIPLRHRKGADPSEWPEDLRVREYPQ